MSRVLPKRPALHRPPVKSWRVATGCCLALTLLVQGSLAAKSEGPADRVHAAELDVLERAGKIYELREKALAAGEMESRDPEVLAHIARIRDAFGDQAPEAYERWVDALMKSDAPHSQITRALERGVVVALRDGDPERARRLSASLDSRFSRVSPSGQSAAVSGLVIAGGIAALARTIDLDPSMSASRFMGEYARAILRRHNSDQATQKHFEGRLKRYFDVLRTLLPLGRTQGEHTEIVLEVSNSAAGERTEKILAVLGWQLRRTPGNNVLLELAPGEENGERQQLGSAFGIDEAAMKFALEARQPFVLRLQHDHVPILVDLAFWEKQAATKSAPSRGLLEDMIYNPRLSGLYVALSSMNPAARQAVLEVLPTEKLLDRTPQLSLYGASISMEHGRLVLPGGAEAVDAWTRLVGANPSEVGTFIENLTKKDGGKLFAYYHALAVLPMENQRFFTRSAPRLARFYKAFPFSDKKVVDAGMYQRKENQFARLAREIPLDREGKVRFPGSDRVWMVAREAGSDIGAVQELLQRADRIRTPDAEDEILLKMLEDEYQNDVHRQFRRIQNFLAVARIDAHRRQPMDETTALMLSQHYAKYEALYPYFAELTELTGPQTISFFKAARRLETFGGNELNTALGEFHALLKLVSLLQGAGAVSNAKAAELVASVCNGFAEIKSARELGGITFDSVGKILGAIEGSSRNDDADELLAQAFAGPEEVHEFSFQGSSWAVNPGAARKRRMREVLRLQKIVPLEVLIQTYRAALQWPAGVDASLVAQVERNLAAIVEIVSIESDKLPGDLSEETFIGRPAAFKRSLRELKGFVGAQKPPARVLKISEDFIADLNPFLKTTLVGWVYAYYLSPQDLVVASNRHFVRSHAFNEPLIRDYWPKARLAMSPLGAHVVGGLAQITVALGDAAATSADSSASVDVHHTAIMQLSAIRSVPWHRIETKSIHVAALKIRIGREFIIQSAFNEQVRDLLEAATVGMLGPARRYELLEAVHSRDSVHAMTLVTATDLYFLADGFLKSPDHGNSSALVSAYHSDSRRIGAEQVDYLGGIHPETAGCVHPHLLSSSPYEESAEHALQAMFNERMSGILLELAESADRHAVPAEAIGLIAESAVREFFKRTRRTPREDWLSAAAAIRGIDLSMFVPMLEKP